MLKDKFLPIGTVVLLKDGTKRVMITSYLIFSRGSRDKKLFDYGACVFPEGIMDSSNTLGFNHDQIKEVIHMGLEDAEEKKFVESLNAIADDFRKKFDEEIANH
jgi:hypothetical protein